MDKVKFDSDSFEQDLVLAMLDSLMKKQLISANTYRATRKRIVKEVEENGCCQVVGGAAEIAV
jgi:hypothetical protein